MVYPVLERATFGSDSEFRRLREMYSANGSCTFSVVAYGVLEEVAYTRSKQAADFEKSRKYQAPRKLFCGKSLKEQPVLATILRRTHLPEGLLNCF